MMRRACWVATLCAASALGCEVRTTNLIEAVSPPRLDAAARDAQTADAGSDTGAPASCRGDHACACDNGIDDDKDGLIDGLDPECTGALDNDERTFATGDDPPNGPCVDCFFDNNVGFGVDGCRYPTECLAGKPPNPGIAMQCGDCSVSETCQSACLPSTPNGCDCFGCCEVRRPDGSRVDVQLTKDCSMQHLDDTKRCPPCVPNPECKNACGQCELCPGQTELDLPAVCGTTTDAGAHHVCDDGSTPCSAEVLCSEQFYCQQGCCLPRLD